jgi:hypothetical protein
LVEVEEGWLFVVLLSHSVSSVLFVISFPFSHLQEHFEGMGDTADLIVLGTLGCDRVTGLHSFR